MDIPSSSPRAKPFSSLSLGLFFFPFPRAYVINKMKPISSWEHPLGVGFHTKHCQFNMFPGPDLECSLLPGRPTHRLPSFWGWPLSKLTTPWIYLWNSLIGCPLLPPLEWCFFLDFQPYFYRKLCIHFHTREFGIRVSCFKGTVDKLRQSQPVDRDHILRFK